METHLLGSTVVQGIAGKQRTLLHYGTSEQFGPPCIVKLAFSLELDQVSSSRYVLERRHRLFIALRNHIACQGGDVTERLPRMAVIVATKELVACACLGAIIVYTEAGQFGQPVLATVHYLHTVSILHMQQPHQ